jgi:hypothetical protein
MRTYVALTGQERILMRLISEVRPQAHQRAGKYFSDQRTAAAGRVDAMRHLKCIGAAF